jgi:hypothetical protein
MHAARSQDAADRDCTQKLAERCIAEGRGFAAAG